MIEHLLNQSEAVDLDARVAVHVLRELHRSAACQLQSLRQVEQDAILAVDRHRAGGGNSRLQQAELHSRIGIELDRDALPELYLAEARGRHEGKRGRRGISRL